MKTTVDIADPLLAKDKRVAEARKTTLRALIEEGLAEVVKKRTYRFELRDASFDGGGWLRDEFSDSEWPSILNASYEDHGS
ncbi:MAG: DUF2191 domain-containing protein [Myxococcota bacterium]